MGNKSLADLKCMARLLLCLFDAGRAPNPSVYRLQQTTDTTWRPLAERYPGKRERPGTEPAHGVEKLVRSGCKVRNWMMSQTRGKREMNYGG